MILLILVKSDEPRDSGEYGKSDDPGEYGDSAESSDSGKYGDLVNIVIFVSSDRSSCTDDGLLYIYTSKGHFFQIFTQSIDTNDTNVSLREACIFQNG